ncbi:MAG: HAD hydrolase family [Candidatus Moranbacteria bacterium GW2011_GWF2_44_10]|nr:MAG: HAD hydrolase family [Candidatus Moranbacteria bacterium GW2011_GWF2_44_10]
MAKKAIMSDAMFTVVRAPFGRWVLYRELIFNLTGVQADPAIIELIYKKERQAAESKGQVAFLKSGDYRRHWGAINANLLRQLDPSISQLEAQEIGEQIFSEVMFNPTNYLLQHELEDFILAAREKDYALYLATNQEVAGIKRILEYFQIRPYFKNIFVSDVIGFKKPDPRFFEHCIKATKCSPGHIAFLGNNPRNDMEGAAAGGISHRFLFDPDGEHLDTECSVSYIQIRSLLELFSHF